MGMFDSWGPPPRIRRHRVHLQPLVKALPAGQRDPKPWQHPPRFLVACDAGDYRATFRRRKAARHAAKRHASW